MEPSEEDKKVVVGSAEYTRIPTVQVLQLVDQHGLGNAVLNLKGVGNFEDGKLRGLWHEAKVELDKLAEYIKTQRKPLY